MNARAAVLGVLTVAGGVPGVVRAVGLPPGAVPGQLVQMPPPPGAGVHMVQVAPSGEASMITNDTCNMGRNVCRGVKDTAIFWAQDAQI